MTNLDSILKSRDITLPTKVQLVKAMVFPVAMYGCESWTIKKGEHFNKELMLLNCGVGEDSCESLGAQELVQGSEGVREETRVPHQAQGEALDGF